jgi:hypothetical protein
VDIHVGLAVVVLQYGVDAADLHASAAWGAGIIDVPRTWNVFGKLVVFVCHRIGVVCTEVDYRDRLEVTISSSITENLSSVLRLEARVSAPR